MPESAPEKIRYLRAVLTQEILFAHSGTDEEILAAGNRFLDDAIDGIWGQNPGLHGVLYNVEITELSPGGVIEQQPETTGQSSASE